MEIEYFPVYTPTEEERKDPMLYASNVQKSLSRTLGLQTTEYTLSDVRAIMGHWDNHVPVSKGMAEFIKLEDKLRFILES
jgi:lysophosphatidylcholine acyltransferase/lyso-PAF acetyltransferase